MILLFFLFTIYSDYYYDYYYYNHNKRVIVFKHTKANFKTYSVCIYFSSRGLLYIKKSFISFLYSINKKLAYIYIYVFF